MSQEDLDAGWDEESEQSATAKAESANAVSQSVAPPNSITIEKTPAKLESAVVRAAQPDQTEFAAPNTSGASPLAVPDTTVAESADVHSPASEAPVQVDRVPDESQLAGSSPEPSATAPQAESSLQGTAPEVASSLQEAVPEVASSLQGTAPEAESSLQGTAPEAESSLEPVVPPASSSISVTQTVSADATPRLETSSQPPSTAAEASLELGASEASSTGAPQAGEPDVQLDLFSAVAERPQLLAEKGVDTGVEAEAAAGLPERDAPSTPDVPVSNESSVKLESSAALVLDEPVTAEAAPRAAAEGYAVRHWRTIAIASTAALLLIVGLLAIRAKHTQTRRNQPAVPERIGDVQAQRVAPALAHPTTTAGEAVATAKPAASAEIGAPEPARPTPVAGAQAESFSDAFVKHAATVNSNWAEVKKRPKAIESSQSNKPAAASNAKANDNPLDLLDKLEKARKAKKSAGK
jgi:hypothetical protein